MVIIHKIKCSNEISIIVYCYRGWNIYYGKSRIYILISFVTHISQNVCEHLYSVGMGIVFKLLLENCVNKLTQFYYGFRHFGDTYILKLDMKITTF